MAVVQQPVELELSAASAYDSARLEQAHREGWKQGLEAGDEGPSVPVEGSAPKKWEPDNLGGCFMLELGWGLLIFFVICGVALHIYFEKGSKPKSGTK